MSVQDQAVDPLARSLNLLSKEQLIDLLLVMTDKEELSARMAESLKAAKAVMDLRRMEVLMDLTNKDTIEGMLEEQGAELKQMILQDW